MSKKRKDLVKKRGVPACVRCLKMLNKLDERHFQCKARGVVRHVFECDEQEQ